MGSFHRMDKKFFTLIRLLFLTVIILSFIPVNAQGVDEQYKQAIESADAYFEKADYLNAKASYQIAAQLKPDEQYPKDRLRESIDLLRIQMEQMAEFNDKLAYADRLYREKSWDSAIAAYREAQKIMPSDPYPADQIKLINEMKADEAASESVYNGLIRDGDALFTSADYAAAREKYAEAAGRYPDRQEVLDKIDLTDQKLQEIADQQSGYEKAISEAEMYHARKDYEKELESYKAAAELKPEEPFPQVKIRELNEFLRKYEAYNSFVSQGDELYISQQFAAARVKYEQALEILPDEKYPKEIISKINIALAEKTERDKAAYDEAIAKADELFNQEDYEAAMVAYSDALRSWPEGEHAQQRLSRISEIQALKKAKEEAYASAISLADKLFAEGSYEEARAEYRKAADLNPFEQYPKVRIDEIDMIMAEFKDKLDQYNAVIQGADKLFNLGDYAQSRIQYLKAQEIMSERSYPADQIRMIDEILGQEKATREAYEAAIARANEHFTNREWEDAKVDYVEANDLIPEEQYPDDRIAEINTILAQLQAEQENYTLALKTADRLFAEEDYNAALLEYRKASEIFTEEEYPKEKIEEINSILDEQTRLAGIEESYNNAIANGDRLLEEGKYQEARSYYETALGIKAGESYPQQKITEIESLMAAAEAARLAQERDEAYAAAIAKADGLFDAQSYAEARAEYNSASGIKPGEQYPADRIAEIDAIFAEQARLQGIDESYNEAIAAADAFLAEQKLNEAKGEYQRAQGIKPDESYPAEKIAEIDAIFAALAEKQEQYSIAIETADAFFGNQEYAEAREAYVRAQGIMPDEPYPAQKIIEIDGFLANLAEQQRIEEGYANAIALGDNHFTNKEYSEARADYETALTFKPAEQYPEGRITEIDGILAELDRQQQLEASYAAAIARADEFFTEEQYAEAKTAYNEALAAKPGDLYASARVSEIDGILAELNRLQEIEDNYTNAIATADAAYDAMNYIAAKEAYNNALLFKPDEQYPAERISEIDVLLIEQARQQAIDAQYNELVASADSLFMLEEYEPASQFYSDALELKPGEVYPGNKINEIEGILAEIARQKQIDESYAESIGTADEYFNRGAFMEALQTYQQASQIKPGEDYPKQRINDINNRLEELEAERQKAYNAAITQADNYYNMANYRNAKAAYQTAVDIKPDEQYARDRLDEVTVLYMAELESLKKDYRKYIADADNYFNSKIYDGAIENYRIAAGILPDESYPGQMIARITKIINDNAITDVNKLAQVIPNNTDRKFGFTALPVNVRKANYILIKAKNVSSHDFKMLVNFGQDNLKNGGVVLQVPKGEATRDYIIRIGAMYKWFSEDNNWLSIYPEGGDIEVALIRISKSD
ncbi:MAG: hypothetical protein V2I47_06500 [Bacteroidales bacterium]|nr:hypothetical protein [Bacteroidales bacterium]